MPRKHAAEAKSGTMRIDAYQEMGNPVKKLAVVALFALSGCAYNLTLSPQGPGDIATGSASKYNKLVTVKIGNTSYNGHYTYRTDGTSISLTALTADMPTISGIPMPVQGAGSGSIIARSHDNHELRCVFNYSEQAGSGTGECVSDTGNIYNLQITRR